MSALNQHLDALNAIRAQHNLPACAEYSTLNVTTSGYANYLSAHPPLPKPRAVTFVGLKSFEQWKEILLPNISNTGDICNALTSNTGYNALLLGEFNYMACFTSVPSGTGFVPYSIVDFLQGEPSGAK